MYSMITTVSQCKICNWSLAKLGLEDLKKTTNFITAAGLGREEEEDWQNIILPLYNFQDIPVDKPFTALVELLKEKRPIGVDHGVEMYSAVELKIEEHDPNDLNRFDPVMVIVEYMRIDNLRLIDLFQFFDSGSRGLVSRDNLRAGVAVSLNHAQYSLNTFWSNLIGRANLTKEMYTHYKNNTHNKKTRYYTRNSFISDQSLTKPSIINFQLIHGGTSFGTHS